MKSRLLRECIGPFIGFIISDLPAALMSSEDRVVQPLPYHLDYVQDGDLLCTAEHHKNANAPDLPFSPWADYTLA